jgi:hypothetical protein
MGAELQIKRERISPLLFHQSIFLKEFFNAQVGAAWIGGGLTSADEANISSRLHTYFAAISAPSG